MTANTTGTRPFRPTPIDTVVIGAGQAGLTMAYRLRSTGRDFVVLDADERIGDCWRQRYDSLRLFSLPRNASLPGWRIPVSTFPTRDQFADYLEAYARRFQLPVRCGQRVSSVMQDGSDFVVTTDSASFLARNVIVATGAHRRPVLPEVAAELDPSIRQLSSLDYRNPGQLAPGRVLVVGAANSGTDVALDAAAAGHPVTLAGRHPGQVPIDIDTLSGRLVVPFIMFAFRHVLTLRTPLGRRFHAAHAGHGVGLVRNKVADLEAAGIEQVGRIERAIDGLPATGDGSTVEAATVVWCTGSVPDHRFLELPVFDEAGRPLHERGVSPLEGLYFLGLSFQFAVASEQIGGVDRDARYLLRRLRSRARRTAAA